MEGSVRKRGDKWYYSFEAASANGKRQRIERPGGYTKAKHRNLLEKLFETMKMVNNWIYLTSALQIILITGIKNTLKET